MAVCRQLPRFCSAIRDVADEPLAESESGALLEGYILRELRAAIASQGRGGENFYWSTPGSKEIHFVWVKGSRRVAVEVKDSGAWSAPYAKTLNEFLAEGRVTRGFVVYRGGERYRSGHVDGHPIEDFLSLICTDSFYGDRSGR